MDEHLGPQCSWPGDYGLTPFLEIQDLNKSFGDTRVLEKLSLSLMEGEILALLGLSGSGKTTALRLLAGFEQPDQGEILVGGEDVTPLSPARRGFGMVFQHYALFPHMTVTENVAFGLKAQGWEKDKIEHRIEVVLQLVDLAGFGNRPVSAISGGQQQRVALARALAPEPRILLLDEPLSNLDPSLREKTRRELRAAVQQIGITTVLVTHEQEEAFHVGDRVAVLHAGRLQQIGTPEELYHSPQTRFVATFVGRNSIIPGNIVAVSGNRAALRIHRHGSNAEPLIWNGQLAEPLAAGDEAELILKPEALRLMEPSSAAAILGEVIERRFTGALTYFTVRLDTKDPLEVEVLAPSSQIQLGDQVGVGPQTDAASGDVASASLGVATSGHLFRPSQTL